MTPASTSISAAPETGELWTPRVSLIILLLLAFAYLAFLGVRPLFIPDEVRYGEIAREMIASGDWIVPRLNGLLYFEKPPFGYWLNALSLLIFGENAFAVRFASVFSVAASTAAVYLLARQFVRGRQAALFAVFVYLTTFEVYGVGTFSVLDSIFAATLNIGIAAVAAAASAERTRRLGLLMFGGACFGLAFLTKGFLAFALPVFVLAPWLSLNRQFGLLFRQGWIIVLVAVAVAAPWAIAIHLREPDFWRYFFWVEHVQRFAGENAQHKAAPYYYVIYLPVVAFPWIFLLPAAVQSLRRTGFTLAYPGVLSLLVLWTTVPLAFFSVASGKLITYILPCFVPFALIVAAGLSRLEVDGRGVRAGLLYACIVPTLFLVGLVYVEFLADNLPGYAAGEIPKLVALLAALLACLAILLYGVSTRKPTRMLSPGYGMGLIIAVLPWIIPVEALHHSAPVAFIREVYDRVPPNAAVVTNGSLVRAVSWALKRNDVFVADSGGETRYGLSADDARGRYLSGDDLGALAKTRAILLFCRDECSRDIMAQVPETATTWRYGLFKAFYFPTRPGRVPGND